MLTIDSEAAAAGLKTSVRVGDRSRMHIAKPPRSGQRRFGRRKQSQKSSAQRNKHAWFWTELPSDAGTANSDLWLEALGTVADRRGAKGAIMSARQTQIIADAFGPMITAAARRHGISEALILAVIQVESAGKPRAKSPKGAQGLMQLIPATAQRFGVNDSYDPQSNIMGGAAYLAWLLDHFSEDPLRALAGYNAGEGAVAKYNGVPPYRETRDYVVKVLDAVVAAERICGALPESPRATCVLR